jgi:hypothetical protein
MEQEPQRILRDEGVVALDAGCAYAPSGRGPAG